jgi:GT2 family glycosyltransferase
MLAVIVMYKLRSVESESFRTLKMAMAQHSHQAKTVRVLLYDNTPGSATDEDVPPEIHYFRSGLNAGIAGAYDYALRMAEREHCDWLLTLDQDTTLPSDFLVRMQATANDLREASEVGAVVPHLVSGGRVVSPVRIRPWGVGYLPREAAGSVAGEIHAFNSGSLFRVASLRQIGGFDERFWLDYQDASIYRRLNMCGKRVYIAEGIHLDHDLSLISEQQAIPPERYRNFVLAESAYCDLYRGRIPRFFLTGRLAGRLLRQLKNGTDSSIRCLTQQAFRRRVLLSRKTRIEAWNMEMERRKDPTMADIGERKPKLSVCMASYNGERFIASQLRSILSQLSSEDEVIVVDDASTDRTRDVVRSLNDERIRLIGHGANQGVSRTFEDAIRAASGNILFLSDQDDVWAPGKVSTILEAFRSHPKVTLVATDNALIDENDKLISSSYFATRGEFRAGLWANLVRNRFGGCTMAFRAEVIGEVLPLPYKYDVLHDLWIGVRNTLSGHEALYIPEALVLNRRHSATATGRKPLTLWRRFRIRAHLLLALAEFRIRRMTLQA